MFDGTVYEVILKDFKERDTMATTFMLGYLVVKHYFAYMVMF